MWSGCGHWRPNWINTLWINQVRLLHSVWLSCKPSNVTDARILKILDRNQIFCSGGPSTAGPVSSQMFIPGSLLVFLWSFLTLLSDLESRLRILGADSLAAHTSKWLMPAISRNQWEIWQATLTPLANPGLGGDLRVGMSRKGIKDTDQGPGCLQRHGIGPEIAVFAESCCYPYFACCQCAAGMLVLMHSR